jgi:hypothetical protein
MIETEKKKRTWADVIVWRGSRACIGTAFVKVNKSPSFLSWKRRLIWVSPSVPVSGSHAHQINADPSLTGRVGRLPPGCGKSAYIEQVIRAAMHGKPPGIRRPPTLLVTRSTMGVAVWSPMLDGGLVQWPKSREIVPLSPGAGLAGYWGRVRDINAVMPTCAVVSRAC